MILFNMEFELFVLEASALSSFIWDFIVLANELFLKKVVCAVWAVILAELASSVDFNI